jgi:hypothetical protein
VVHRYRSREEAVRSGTASVAVWLLPKLLPGWKAAVMVQSRHDQQGGADVAERRRVAVPVAIAFLAAVASLAAAVSCEPIGKPSPPARWMIGVGIK